MMKQDSKRKPYENEEILTEEQKQRELTKEEYVAIENKWIEEKFGCDITTPYMTEDQMEDLELGLPVKPNIKVESQNPEQIREIVEELLSKV